jgi:hypothetical protein
VVYGACGGVFVVVWVVEALLNAVCVVDDCSVDTGAGGMVA